MPPFALVLLCSITLLSSCVPVVIGGTGAAAFISSKMIVQDKTVGESISDTTIWAKIRTGLANQGIDNILGTVSIEIQEGRVLLTGTVPDKNKILTILRVCWSTNGVKEVINEIRIKESKDSSSAFDNIKDSWITTKVKSKLLASREVKSINYSVESIDGIVYLFGIAQSQQELDVAIGLISNTASVKKVVSYVKVKKDLNSLVADTKGIQSEEDFGNHSQSDGNEALYRPNEQIIVPQPTAHSATRPVLQDETTPSTPSTLTTNLEPKTAQPKTKANSTTDTTDSVFEKDDF